MKTNKGSNTYVMGVRFYLIKVERMQNIFLSRFLQTGFVNILDKILSSNLIKSQHIVCMTMHASHEI